MCGLRQTRPRGRPNRPQVDNPPNKFWPFKIRLRDAQRISSTRTGIVGRYQASQHPPISSLDCYDDTANDIVRNSRIFFRFGTQFSVGTLST